MSVLSFRDTFDPWLWRESRPNTVSKSISQPSQAADYMKLRSANDSVNRALGHSSGIFGQIFMSLPNDPDVWDLIGLQSDMKKLGRGTNDILIWKTIACLERLKKTAPRHLVIEAYCYVRDTYVSFDSESYELLTKKIVDVMYRN